MISRVIEHFDSNLSTILFAIILDNELYHIKHLLLLSFFLINSTDKLFDFLFSVVFQFIFHDYAYLDIMLRSGLGSHGATEEESSYIFL